MHHSKLRTETKQVEAHTRREAHQLQLSFYALALKQTSIHKPKCSKKWYLKTTVNENKKMSDPYLPTILDPHITVKMHKPFQNNQGRRDAYQSKVETYHKIMGSCFRSRIYLENLLVVVV